jgi:hypothetical protein
VSEDAPTEYYEFASDWNEILKSGLFGSEKVKKIRRFWMEYENLLENYVFDAETKAKMDLLRKRIGNPKPYIHRARNKAKFEVDPNAGPLDQELIGLLNKDEVTPEDRKRMDEILKEMGKTIEKAEAEELAGMEVAKEGPSPEQLEKIETGEDVEPEIPEAKEEIPEMVEQRNERIKELQDRIKELQETLPGGEEKGGEGTIRTQEQKDEMMNLIDELNQLMPEQAQPEFTFLNYDIEDIRDLATTNLDEADLRAVHPEDHVKAMRDVARQQMLKFHGAKEVEGIKVSPKDTTVLEELTFAQAAFVSEFLKEELKKYNFRKRQQEYTKERDEALETRWRSEKQPKLTPEERAQKMKESGVKVYNPEEIAKYEEMVRAKEAKTEAASLFRKLMKKWGDLENNSGNTVV